MKWTGKTFTVQILGKRYTLSSIADYQQALDKLSKLYQEAPMTGAGEGEPEADLGGEEGGEPEADLGGEEGGEEPPADLGGEEIDFEEPAEEPEA